ncbi:hypothetical protein ACTJJ0_07885 [Chitinophaga sp. 22321]|uniref:Uncharacterized protein n=1 Tax=Chitinophaga hostae TaxID=2831022 RepID=A0ABS5ITS3_9BACT|nr:hypothetical protein [Chitinophaga hostae]MBS0026278.1 hypothetical protein [Chitinophaga hostae]
MRNNHAGTVLIICKKYTENGKRIRWQSSGELSIQSGKSIIMNGKQHGIKFEKNNLLSN